MKNHNTLFRSTTLAVAFVISGLAGSASAEDADNSCKLLSTEFEPRHVVKIEAGDFHFKPGQPAPIHTHVAPAIGYIAKGTVLYQVEGEEPQLLHKGDAFYEPVGPRILHFDNASASEEAIFVDINLQQQDEPFIVFEQPLSEPIDRRTLPTATLNGDSVDRVNVYAHTLKPGESEEVDRHKPVIGYVAEGSVELHIEGKAPQRVNAGESFYQPIDSSGVVLVNTSSKASVKVIEFNIHKS